MFSLSELERAARVAVDFRAAASRDRVLALCAALRTMVSEFGHIPNQDNAGNSWPLVNEILARHGIALEPVADGGERKEE